MITHPDPKVATKTLILTRGSQGKVLRIQISDHHALSECPSLSTFSTESSQGRLY